MNSLASILERTAERYLPYDGHYPRADVVLMKDDSYLSMARLDGSPHELASDTERAGTAKFLNTLWRQIHKDTLTLGIYLVSTRRYDQLPAAAFHSEFAQKFDRAYTENILDEMYDKTWFISLIASPRLPFGNQKEYSREFARLVDRFRFRKESLPDSAVAMATMDDTWQTIDRTLDGHGLRRLGTRIQNRYIFSEIAEALRQILYCQFLPVGLTDGPLGNTIYTDRAVFSSRHYRLLHPRRVRYGTIFGLREYMADTIAGMFDKVLPLPMEFVVSQSFGFMPRQQAITRLRRKQRQMVSSNDAAYAQITDIDNALSELAGDEVVRGVHHISVAVYGDTYEQLDHNRGDMRDALASSGAVVTEESLANEAAFFAQLPSPGKEWAARPGAASSRNLGHLADFGSFPKGKPEGRWGRAPIRFRTIGRTAYDYIPHTGEDGDVGMTAFFGKTGSGKTVLLSALLLMLDQNIGDDGIIFRFGKDRDGELLVRALDGSFLEVRAGEASGLAPLRGLQNTPSDCAFLERWIKALIMFDGHGPISPQDDARVARAVKAIMRKPIELRDLAGLREYLAGWRDPQSAGARLERWCRGGANGWAFDGDEDEVDIATRVVGFDLTAILDNPEIVNPAAQYLLYRISLLFDGRRVVLSLDEADAYTLHPLIEHMTDDVIRRGRKNNVVVYLATQQPELFFHSVFGTTVIEQCLTKFVFRNDTASEDTWREKMKFTEGEFKTITEGILPGSHQFLIHRKGESAVIDFDLMPIRKYVGILSGRARTVRYAEQLRERNPHWVEEFMNTFETAARD